MEKSLSQASSKPSTSKKDRMSRRLKDQLSFSAEEYDEKYKSTLQKVVFEKPTGKLDHLKHVAVAMDDLGKWAQVTSYNSDIDDVTRIECYVCGGPGHFMEICPLHMSLTERFGMHGLRAAIYGRALNNKCMK